MATTRSSTDRVDPVEISGRLAGICGPGFTRSAGAADEVAGAPARWVAAPPDAAAVSELLRLADDHGLSVVPRGAGTKLDWGAPPSTVDVVLDTGRLAGVTHRPRGELVADVGAGTPVRAVQAVLERAGRRLAVDVPSEDATVGGVLAADEAGPLGHRHGTACQQVVGLSYVDASGKLHHVDGGSSGPAEPELTRLLCGSQGALGVLVSATLRVQPLPASRIWVSHPVWTPLQMHDLLDEVLEAGLDPAAIEVDLPGCRPRPGSPAHPASPSHAAYRRHPSNHGRPPGQPVGHLTLLLEGGRSQVADRLARLRALLRQFIESTVPPPWWRRYPFDPGDVALRLEVPIDSLHAAIYALRDAVGIPVPVRGSAGRGVVHAALPGDLPPDQVSAVLTAVRTILVARQGRCVVLSAPPRVRRAVDLWGDLPDLPLFRRIKERFDPSGRLAPGRYLGGF